MPENVSVECGTKIISPSSQQPQPASVVDEDTGIHEHEVANADENVEESEQNKVHEVTFPSNKYAVETL